MSEQSKIIKTVKEYLKLKKKNATFFVLEAFSFIAWALSLIPLLVTAKFGLFGYFVFAVASFLLILILHSCGGEIKKLKLKLKALEE